MGLLNKLITHNIVINEIKECEDSTILNVRLCIMDSMASPNGWRVTKDVIERCKNTLINKPIVCKYYPEINNELGTDSLGDHEETTVVVRGTNGEVTIPYNDTISIGVITDVETIEIEDSDEVQLWANGSLWLTKEFNSVSLIYEWAMNGININTSVEWGYSDGTSLFIDGIEYMSNITFTGLCVLNSVSNKQKPVIYGNYSCSNLNLATNDMIKRFNNAIKADIDNVGINNIENYKNGKESVSMENKFLMALNQISLGETRDKVMDALSKVLTAEEYNNAWVGIYGIYDDYIVYETYTDNEWKNFKVNYAKTEEDDIQIDINSKVEIEYQFELVEKSTVNNLQTKVNELLSETNTVKDEKSKLEESVSELEQKLTTANNTAKTLNDQIDKLNEKVNELEPYKLKVDKDEFDSKLNEKVEYYESKFNALSGKNLFESDEVQQLIKDTLDNEKCENAKIKLDSIMVGLVKPIVNNSKKQSTLVEPATSAKINIPSQVKSDLELYRD